MGEKTLIEWTDATWNPWRGCIKVSSGCKNCYMYQEQTRFNANPADVIRSSPKTFNSPLTWKEGKKVFTCSWSDFFIKEADEWRNEAWQIIKNTPHLTYQILTKRPERVSDHLPQNWGDGYPNVWLGVSIEQEKYLKRMDEILAIPAWVHFISYEPALEEINFGQKLRYFDWLISGGESGPNARYAQTSWFESARQQCEENKVAFFHKQNGGAQKTEGAYGGMRLNGKIYHNFPVFS